MVKSLALLMSAWVISGCLSTYESVLIDPEAVSDGALPDAALPVVCEWAVENIDSPTTGPSGVSIIVPAIRRMDEGWRAWWVLNSAQPDSAPLESARLDEGRWGEIETLGPFRRAPGESETCDASDHCRVLYADADADATVAVPESIVQPDAVRIFEGVALDGEVEFSDAGDGGPRVLASRGGPIVLLSPYNDSSRVTLRDGEGRVLGTFDQPLIDEEVPVSLPDFAVHLDESAEPDRMCLIGRSGIAGRLILRALVFDGIEQILSAADGGPEAGESLGWTAGEVLLDGACAQPALTRIDSGWLAACHAAESEDGEGHPDGIRFWRSDDCTGWTPTAEADMPAVDYANTRRTVAFTALPGGGALAAWGGPTSIYLVQFDASGEATAQRTVPVGPEEGRARNVSIAADDTGRQVLVAWSDDGLQVRLLRCTPAE